MSYVERVTRTIPAETITEGVTIELNVDEALALQQVLYRVGGCPSGPRGLMQELEVDLEEILGDPEQHENDYEMAGNIRMNPGGEGDV